TQASQHDMERLQQRARLVPHGVRGGAAHQQVQELANGESKQDFVFDVQMRRHLVMSGHASTQCVGGAAVTALLMSPAMVCASSTTARPPTAANAASLAHSIRRGLPLAVMYRKPAQARNSAAAARPTLVAASSSAPNM